MKVKKGIIRLTRGESCTISLGSGFLFLFDEHIAYEGFYYIPYWSSEIKKYDGHISAALSVTKTSISIDVNFEFIDSFTNSSQLTISYFFIGG